jgi:hypothetical protein
MADDKALVPVEEQTVDFYGDAITTALVEVNGRTTMYVPIKPISDYLGLTWSGQFERIQRDPVLSEVVTVIRLTRITATGGVPGSLCLPIEYLNGWLFGINASRVKSELREKIIRYQRDCYHVLWEAFKPAVSSPQDIESTQGTQSLEHIREMGLAIARMAEQQIEMEQRLNKAAQVFTGFDRRLTAVEKKLSPAMLISDDQAATISSTVKALAELMTTKEGNKNHYQGIFSELYRRFGVSSYKNIRLDHYEQVLRFLENWRQTLSKES